MDDNVNQEWGVWMWQIKNKKVGLYRVGMWVCVVCVQMNAKVGWGKMERSSSADEKD